MPKLDSIKPQMDYTLNHAMKTLDKAIALIPDDKLGWKPVDDAMSAAELGIHVYMCSLVYSAGTLKGEFTTADYSIIPFDPKTVKSAADIVDYGKKVKNYIKEILPKLTEADMDKEVTYSCWGDVKVGGFASMATILEETIHHRGQLCIYLRMLGIKPPFIYDIGG
ncbi:MAG: DinB family protein [Candidatus Thorarchaeota archaeon]